MICCDKCGSVIDEPKEEPEKEKEESAGKRYKKEAAPVELQPRRPSLVNLPYTYGATSSEFIFKEFDLCPTCRAKLTKQVNTVKLKFLIHEVIGE
jgi:hypothetical protein